MGPVQFPVSKRKFPFSSQLAPLLLSNALRTTQRRLVPSTRQRLVTARPPPLGDALDDDSSQLAPLHLATARQRLVAARPPSAQ